ncbi:hypothetical protein D9756_006646 [Leucocoprinus leucothites]|uniref:Uncharacterized protein n=1 Tax=Leucocoprinus leucothites TaxID=201217 RepID=A0A8H5G2V6_9AGAR|nr:hypothetical protein D9756_006646 [Leucoagaricus leucothites]
MNFASNTSHSASLSPDPDKSTIAESNPVHRESRGWIGRMERILHDPHQRPLLIALGPLPTLCFVWAVFAITYTRSIPLPDYFAKVVSAHPQSMTMIAAIVATVLASQVSFFFSLAVRYVIAIRLVTRSTSLDVLTSATRIAQRSLWLHYPFIKWTWIVLLAYLSVSFQTSALTALFDVRRIRVCYPVNGSDLNMANAQLLQISNNMQLELYKRISPFYLQNIMVDAIQFRKNIPAIFNFGGYAYTSTTGGIHPAAYVPIYHKLPSTNFTTTVTPANLNDLNASKHTQLPFNKTMTLVQQGFTADVYCQTRDLQANATYNPTLSTQPIGTAGLSMVQLSANCPGSTSSISDPIIYNTSDVTSSGGILGVWCQVPNTNTIDVIIRASGIYQPLDLVVCSVSPKTTIVNVTYAVSPQKMDVPMTINVSKPITTADVPVLGEMAIDVLLSSINLSQGLQINTLANIWLLTGVILGDVSLADAMSIYIRASFELMGSTIRLILTQPELAAALADPDSSFFTPINGTFSASTYGWHQDHTISPLLMLPTTVTILATYGLLIYGLILARKHTKALVDGDGHFDPTDIVHVIAAHTPETRQQDFRDFSQKSTSYMRKTAVKMEDKGGVRAFQISSG